MPKHGIKEAFYELCFGSGLRAEYKPRMRCLCGWQNSNGPANWEQVGSEFDRRLKNPEAATAEPAAAA